MKKAIFFSLAILFTSCISAQEIDKEALKARYQKKRNTNLVLGWTTLSAGAGLVIAGIARDKGEELDPLTYIFTLGLTGRYENSAEKTTLVLLGSLIMPVSILFFEFARHNKKKMMELGLSNVEVSRMYKTYIANTSIPALSLKINL